MTEKPAQKPHPGGDDRYKLLDRAITKHHGRGDAFIEVLHVAQGIFGYLENDLLIYVARALKLPLSRVYGVATFYHFFTLKPGGRHTFVLCTGTACYLKGSAAIQTAVEDRCGARFGETTDDNAVSLVSARCVGHAGLLRWLSVSSVLPWSTPARNLPSGLHHSTGSCLLMRARPRRPYG